MTPKVLVIVKDGVILIRHTTGVETAVIVDGEDVDLPDDWQDLPWRALHTVPVRLEDPQEPTPSSQIFENQGQKRPSACPETQLAAPNTQVQHATAEKYVEDGQPAPTTPELEQEISGLMKAPYCHACDGNHPDGECPGAGDVFARDGRS